MNRDFYVKKVFYGNEVRIYASERPLIDYRSYQSFNRTNYTRKTTGIKTTKSLARTKRNFIEKAIHNFYDANVLSFMTLTYGDGSGSDISGIRETRSDIKIARKDIAAFMRNLQNWWYDREHKLGRKRSMGIIKYCYTYEYQEDGTIHFHIIFNRKVWFNQIWKFWVNKGYGKAQGQDIKYIRQKNQNPYVIKYLAKYISKTAENVFKLDKRNLENPKEANKKDLNVRLYSFSLNCTKPLTEVAVYELNDEALVFAVQRAHFFKFSKVELEDGATILSGLSAVFYRFHDPFNYRYTKKLYISYKMLSFYHEYKIKGYVKHEDYLFLEQDWKQKIKTKNDVDFEQAYCNFEDFEFHDFSAQTFFSTTFPNYDYKSKREWYLTQEVINWDAYLVKKIRNLI